MKKALSIKSRKNCRTSLRIQGSIIEKIRESMVNQNYSSKARSLWISEAIDK